MSKREGVDTGAVRLEMLPCLVGGDIETPIVLPVVEEAGVRCIALNAYEPWMSKFLEGKSRGSRTGHVVKFVGGLVNAIKECNPFTEDDSQTSSALETESPAAARAAPAKGRAALGLDEDSDENLSCQADLVHPPGASTGSRAHFRPCASSTWT